MNKYVSRSLCGLLMLGGASTASASLLSGVLVCDANQNQQIDFGDYILEGTVTAVVDSIISLNGVQTTHVGKVYQGSTDASGDYSFSIAYPATAEYTTTVSNLTLAGVPLSNPTYIDPNSSSTTFVIENSGDNAIIDWLVDSPDCHPAQPFCGDGNLDLGEECDDGNTVDGDQCSSTCSIESFCGDGNLDLTEGCDDGNNINGDGCSASCTNESYCGDSVLDIGEQCDDGNNIAGDGCSSICTQEAYCGDGNVDAGEQCDDGNYTNGDGCSAVCTEEVAGEGCTPGYWKQSQHFDSWSSPYTPDTQFSDVFDDAFPGMSLLDVMNQGDGKLYALGRHTVAGLLNSVSTGVSYEKTEIQVIDMFNNAYPGNTGSYNATKGSLEYYNEIGCPLN